MDISNKVLDRLLKIAELAKRGVDGEARNAEDSLEFLCNKYGVTVEAILEESPPKEYREFYYQNKTEKHLLIQVALFVAGRGTRAATTPGRNNHMELEVSAAHYIEIKCRYGIYRKELKEELKITFESFIHKNSIFPPDDGKEHPEKEYTAEERRRIHRVVNRMGTMDRVEIHKQLGTA